MGYATIVSGGTDGRYTIRIDAGQAMRDAVVAGFTRLLADLETRLATAIIRVQAAEAKENEQRLRLAQTIDVYIQQSQQSQIGNTNVNTKAVTFEMQRLQKLQTEHQPLRLLVRRLKFEKFQTQRKLAYWTDIEPTTTRQAWCTTYTTDAAPDSIVATIEIPGDSNLVLIAPECRAPTNADGYLRARAVMSPEQAFFNAAIFPGWQKFKPTYRWGEIIGIDYEAETATVELAEATSSAQGLNVNQASTLVDVPVEYLECGVGVFELGDRVVVQFVGQNWDDPKVIGFLDNPRPCNYPCFMNASSNYLFESLQSSIHESIWASGVWEVRINGGAWSTMVLAAGGTSSAKSFYDQAAPNQIVIGSIQRYTNTDPLQLLYQAPPHLAIVVAPGPPIPPPPRSLEQRRIAEIRIRVAGETVFNAAVRDFGWGGEGVTIGYVKTRGGINLRSLPNIAGDACELLEGYTLDP